MKKRILDEKLQRLVLCLSYKSKEPVASDELKTSNNMVAKILGLKTSQVKVIVDKFKQEHDPNLSDQ